MKYVLAIGKHLLFLLKGFMIRSITESAANLKLPEEKNGHFKKNE
jgi:hypothetical protein